MKWIDPYESDKYEEFLEKHSKNNTLFSQGVQAALDAYREYKRKEKEDGKRSGSNTEEKYC